MVSERGSEQSEQRSIERSKLQPWLHVQLSRERESVAVMFRVLVCAHARVGAEREHVAVGEYYAGAPCVCVHALNVVVGNKLTSI